MADSRGLAGIKVNDGYYEIKYQGDGVYLVVYPAVGSGRRITAEEVVSKLNHKQVKSFARASIELAVLKADKTPVRIAEAQEEIKVNASASVSVSQDKMKAFITINSPEGGSMLRLEEIVELLAKNGVIYGINKSTLETIIKYPVYNEMICVAEGTPPVNGQNGRVDYCFDVRRDGKPTILEDGRVDYRELNLVESVHQGQMLCSLVLPVKGTPGKTVYGAVLPALNGNPAKVPKGRNVEVTGDGQSLIAAIDGQVSFIDGKVNVFANYEVHADVDPTTGNINFIGNVTVRGNVLSGFTIEAGGNVEVWGVVEGATIKAGGDIILRRGMQGVSKGVLVSGGDIIAKYIEYSSVEARNDIKSEAIMHSNVKCGNRLELGGRKGLLVGGTCKVGNEVAAKVIGSQMNTVTDIEVGVDPHLRERYKACREEVATIEADIKKAEQAIAILKKLEQAGALTPEKQDIMAKSVRTKIYYSNRIEEIKAEVAQIEARLQQEANGKIKIYSIAYPGTKVAIGSCIMYIKENLQYCTLYRDGADVRVGSIS